MRICLLAKPDAVHTRRMVFALVERGFSVHVMFNGDGAIPGATYEPFKIPDLDVRHPNRRDVRRNKYLRDILNRHDLVAAFFLHHWRLDRETVGDSRLAVWPWGSDVCPPPIGPAPGDATLNRRRTMLRAATAISTCGPWFAEKVANFAAIPRKRITVTPLGVDSKRFRPASQPAGETIVGFMKGFGHAYGSTDVVRAIPRVLAEAPRTRFEMIGDGPLLDECQKLAQRLNVAPFIRWMPPQPHDRVADVINRWSLSVMPSLCESFGVAALESSACGVPVVASSVGGFRETVRHNSTGLLVSPSDPDLLARAILRLVRDKTLRHHLGENGRRMVQHHYEWRDCADRWAEYFVDAANRSSLSPSKSRDPNNECRSEHQQLAGAAT